MNQEGLTRSLAKRFFLTKIESNQILHFILERISDELKKGERIYFRGFGSFTKEKHAPKKVRHPKSGRLISVPGRILVRFKPSIFLLKKIQ